MVEQVIRQRGHGFAADIWSFGCTVLEMATGKPPWSQCSTQVQAIFKIASSSELPQIPESLSPEGTEFVLLCLQRDSAARPSAADLLKHPFVADVDTSHADKLADLLHHPWSAPIPHAPAMCPCHASSCLRRGGRVGCQVQCWCFCSWFCSRGPSECHATDYQ